MRFDPQILPGEEIRNERLCDIFRCSPQGGMRRSKTTNSLILVSNHTESIYDDRWIGDIFHYTGMGQSGDQSLSSHQNRTLSESATNGVQVFLFEIFRPLYYTYIGEVELAEKPYSEEQPDRDGKRRKVWIFPLRLKDHESVVISAASLQKREELQTKRARKLSDHDLLERVSAQRSELTERRVTMTQYYYRDPSVGEYAWRRAKGMCQLCDRPAPFMVKGAPFLEVHHVVPLADGGQDTIENTVALCPNCHRKMHHIADHDDQKRLLNRALEHLVKK